MIASRHPIRGVVAALAIALLVAPAVASPAPPTLQRLGSWWVLQDLPPILDDQEIQKALTSGLTTSFHLTASIGAEAAGAARVEIRYLLWEEAFLARVIRSDGNVVESQPQTIEDLRVWWHDLRIGMLPIPPARSGVESLLVNLDVLPFSAREEEDTQRWLSQTLSRRNESTEVVSGPAAGSLSHVFNVLISTSIRRRSVRSYQWKVALPTGVSP